MPKLIISIDGVVIKEAELTGERTTLGRRPYNDIVIDNLAVSGEHAVLYLNGAEVFIEDLNSTNGTYVNGKAIKHQLLQNNDIIEVGKYKIRFQADPVGVAAAAPASPAPTPRPWGRRRYHLPQALQHRLQPRPRAPWYGCSTVLPPAARSHWSRS